MNNLRFLLFLIGVKFISILSFQYVQQFKMITTVTYLVRIKTTQFQELQSHRINAKLYCEEASSHKTDNILKDNLLSTTDNLVKYDTTDESIKEKNIKRSYFVLAILLITFASNQWSRQAMYYLCDFSSGSIDPFKYMNRGLNFSKEMYAALASFGFTLVFAIVSLFSGDVSDKYSRNQITSLSCLVWSVATAAQSFATKFSDLVPLRAIIGASQAFYNPAAYTLLADIFPARMVGSINGIFSGGIYLGGALASLSIVLDDIIGWRSTLLLIGGIGIVASILCFLIIPEPRDSQRTTVNTSFADNTIESNIVTVIEENGNSKLPNRNLSDMIKDAIQALFDVVTPYQAKLLFSAATLRFCAGFSIGIWKAPFIFDKFPGSEVSFSLYYFC